MKYDNLFGRLQAFHNWKARLLLTSRGNTLKGFGESAQLAARESLESSEAEHETVLKEDKVCRGKVRTTEVFELAGSEAGTSEDDGMEADLGISGLPLWTWGTEHF